MNNKRLFVAITDKCNLRCTYCRTGKSWYDSFGGRNINKVFPIEKWSKIIDYCTQHHISKVFLTGGEPFEYERLNDLILFLNSHNLEVTIFTNGLSNKNSLFYEFIRKNLNLKINIFLSVELNTNLQKTFKKNILPIQFISEINKLSLPLNIKFVLTPQMINLNDSIGESLEWWSQYQIKSIRFQPVVPVVSKSFELSNESICLIDELIEIKKNKSFGDHFLRNSFEYLDSLKKFILSKELPYKLIEKCPAKENINFMDQIGNIYNCKSLYNKNDKKKCEEVFDLNCFCFLK